MREKLIATLSHYQFAAMICLAVVLTSVLTSISIWVYTSSGAINIDLSRPGYEQIREETTATETETQFQTSGPIDADVITDFNSRLETLQAEINSMNNFSSDVMSDQALGIAESQ